MNNPLMLAAFTLPLASPALADETPTSLGAIVVTATRTPEPQSKTLASVTLIDRAEIERRQARSVPDLLRGVAGVAVAQNGGPGQNASVFLRGTNADHVLVLVDGVKIGSATSGTPPLESLPIEQIERIEIVRGPRSSLYGSEAIGGVIQIFTRKGGGAPTPYLALSGGTLGTGGISTGISGGGDRAWLNVGASLDRTDGINACNGRSSPYAGCGVEEPDRDRYRNLGLSLRAGYRLSETAELDVHLLRSESRSHFDGSIYSGNLARSEQQILGASATWRPLEPWMLTVSAGRSWDKYRTYYDDLAQGIDDRFVDAFETERDTASLQSNLAITADQLVTLGLDYQADRVSGTIDYAKDHRDNVGLFGQYQGRWGPTDLKLGLRRDENQQFGDHATGSAALGYLLESDIQLSISYATAFKAPSFNDLYYPNYGSPDLDPEQSRSLELGLGGPLPLGPRASGSWEASLYETRIDDLIAYDSTLYAAANIREARIRGMDASAEARVQDWTLGLTLTLIDPQNRSTGTNRGNLLPRRPEQSARLDLDRRFARWSAGASLFVAGRRYDDLANQVRLPGYALLDLRAEYALSPELRLQARLENALDEDYETAYLYNQPGRAFYLTLRYEPYLP